MNSQPTEFLMKEKYQVTWSINRILNPDLSMWPFTYLSVMLQDICSLYDLS